MRKVEAYQTNDGIVFTSRKSAALHELEIAIKDNIKAMIDKASVYAIVNEDLEQFAINFLISNRKKLHEIFNNYGPEPEEVRQPNID